MSYTATVRISLLQLFKLRGFQLLSFAVPQAVTWLIHMVYVQMYIKSKSHSLEQSRMTVTSHARRIDQITRRWKWRRPFAFITDKVMGRLSVLTDGLKGNKRQV